jgi:predicted adenine nucleotide alpha hydrolase (AANH) superfamily ATPase
MALAFINPNIQPRDEHRLRREVFAAWAAQEGHRVLEGHDGSQEDFASWEKAVAPVAEAALAANANNQTADERARENRCRLCYRLRFEQLAAAAAREGFDAIATTLTISPYQLADVIEQELVAAAMRHGVTACFEDYRPWYAQSVSASRELGMYRQNYCGCRYSKAEADKARAARKAARAQEREKKRALKQEQGQEQEQGQTALSETRPSGWMPC